MCCLALIVIEYETPVINFLRLQISGFYLDCREKGVFFFIGGLVCPSGKKERGRRLFLVCRYSMKWIVWREPPLGWVEIVTWKLNRPPVAICGIIEFIYPLHGHFFTQSAQKRIDVGEHGIWAAGLPEKNRK